jgi:hypothetical protein
MKRTVTVTVMGQFTIEADSEKDYEAQRETMLDNAGDLGIELGVESEDTEDGLWFDDDEDEETEG